MNFSELQSKISKTFTLDILHDILRKQSGCDIVILENISFGKATKKGDSYLSNITRFTVIYTASYETGNKAKVLHVIAKSLIRNIAQRKTFRSYDFFKNEVNFYNKVWPLLNTYQEKKNVKDKFTELPNYLHGYIDGENDYVLLEDLSFTGYKSVDRSVELDVTHVKMVLKVFARFHALSIAFKQDNPEVFEKSITGNLSETYYHEKYRNWYTNFQGVIKKVTLDAVEQELPKTYYEKLEKILQGDFYGTVCDLINVKSDLTTVTHGDAWIPNFLSEYDENNTPIRTIMIDFQLTRCAPLAQDLLFFIYSCTNEELRSKHFDELLVFYSEEFQKFYNQFHKETLVDHEILLKEFKKNGLFGLSMSMEAVIMSMLDDDEVSDLDLIEGQEAVPLESVWIVKPLKVKEKRQRVACFIKEFFDRQFV